jgi:hypothetical protein
VTLWNNFTHFLTDAVNGDQEAQTGEWNADVRYAFAADCSVALGLYNILNHHADGAEFRYLDRLHGEPVDGIAGPKAPSTVCAKCSSLGKAACGRSAFSPRPDISVSCE